VTEALGIGLIGCGNVATQFHLPAYLGRPGRARVVALADLSTERLAEAAAIAGVRPNRSFTDYADLLACPDVEVVDICAPQQFHAQIARAAAAAGKHILCEKPIATVPADAQAMLDAAHAARVTVGVMHNYLFYPEYVAARQVLDSGEIGAVHLAIVNYLGVPDLPGAGEAAASWRHDPIAAGGGVLIDMVHALYVAEHLLGRRAERVSAYVAGNGAHPRVEATALCRIETDGPPALVNVGWGIGPGGVFVEGDRGSLEIRWRNGGTNPFEPLEWIEVRTSEGTRRLDLPAGLELYPLVIEGIGGVIDDFVDAVATGRAPAASGADGLHALELTLGAYKSAVIGRTVSLPLETADPVYSRGVAAIPELGGPSWSPVLRQRLYTTD
jgi:predicted dehydrogenase